MFNRKKKEDLSDQLATFRERDAPRFTPKAGISIEGMEGEGKLGNISVSGCCLESVTYAAIVPDEEYTVTIIPDASENITPFTLVLKLTWTKSSEMLFQAGFTLGETETNTLLKRYVEALESRGIRPDYGNMNVGRR